MAYCGDDPVTLRPPEAVARPIPIQYFATDADMYLDHSFFSGKNTTGIIAPSRGKWGQQMQAGKMLVPCESCQSIFLLNRSLVKSTGTRVRCSKCYATFKVYPPEPIDRRKYPRVRTNNLISYFAFDENGKLITQGMGITLDISRGGMLFETPDPIDPGLLVLGATDLENHLIEVKGKLIHCTKAASGMYHSGIEFLGLDERVTKFITKLVRDHKYRGYNLFIAIARKLQNVQSEPVAKRAPRR